MSSSNSCLGHSVTSCLTDLTRCVGVISSWGRYVICHCTREDLSHCHNVTWSHFHLYTVTLSHWHIVTLSLCHVLVQSQNVEFQYCLILSDYHYHTIMFFILLTLSCCYNVKMSQCLNRYIVTTADNCYQSVSHFRCE